MILKLESGAHGEKRRKRGNATLTNARCVTKLSTSTPSLYHNIQANCSFHQGGFVTVNTWKKESACPVQFEVALSRPLSLQLFLQPIKSRVRGCTHTLWKPCLLFWQKEAILNLLKLAPSCMAWWCIYVQKHAWEVCALYVDIHICTA